MFMTDLLLMKIIFLDIETSLLLTLRGFLFIRKNFGFAIRAVQLYALYLYPMRYTQYLFVS